MKDALKPGFLINKLRTAKTLATSTLADGNLAGDLEEEILEQTILTEVVNVWRHMGVDELRPRVVDKFPASMSRLGSHPGVLKCAPPIRMFKEQT